MGCETGKRKQPEGLLSSPMQLWLLLSRFSRVRLCATPKMAAHQAPPSLGFSRQEHWSGLPFPSPMHEREKWKGSRLVVSNPQRPHGLQPTRLLRPWDFPGKSTGVGCHRLLLCTPSSVHRLYCIHVQSLSCFSLFITPWTIAHQAPLSVEFSRQECWSGLSFPSPGDLLH